MIRVHLEVCDSTQDEVRQRLTSVDAGDIVIVSADSQRAGRGREGRTWQDPPGTALMVSVGRRGPLPVSVLEHLPERIADVILGELDAPELVHWKAPNDLITVADGAKVAGILVDARTTGDRVDQVIVGMGLNVTGEPFVTADGRAATSLAALGLDRTLDRLPDLIASTLT